jgi:hypothetical protein
MFSNGRLDFFYAAHSQITFSLTPLRSYTTEPECALLQVIPPFPLRAFPSSLLTPFPPQFPLAAAFRLAWLPALVVVPRCAPPPIRIGWGLRIPAELIG